MKKSIIQNFIGGNDLDIYFNKRKGYDATNIFKNKLQEKFDCKLKEIYYMIFICNKKNIYLSCIKFNVENIYNMKFAGFTKTCKNILIDNFIDNNIGNVKLYKSKKRLELRLSKDLIKQKYSTKIYEAMNI